MLYRDFATQEAIDAEYDVERRVPDAASWFEFFVEESRRARAELDCLLDVAYGPTRAETLDIFPAADADAPILVFVHGGYWRRLSAREFSFVARGPVARGITVVVTNYALCPQVTIPEITRQSRAAVAWLWRSEGGFAGDRERLFVAGHSAGGHQVARLLATDWVGEYALPADVVKGGYALSGLFDLRPLRYSWLQPLLQLDGDVCTRESPLLNLPAAAPPLVADVGALESSEFHRQSRAFVDACRASGLDARYLEQENCHHFSVIAGLGDPDSLLCGRLCELIERCGRQGEDA